MSNPEPRRDDKNAPWCTPCDCDEILYCHQKNPKICLPQVRIDEAGLVEAESENARLDAAAKQADADGFEAQKKAARLQGMLDKWPRVYWNSSPKSIEEGFRVLSVSGCEGCDCEESWFDVYVDDPEHDGDCAAPADVGLYSSSEDAIAAREQKT